MPRPLDLLASIAAGTVGAALAVAILGASPWVVLPVALVIGLTSVVRGHRRPRT